MGREPPGAIGAEGLLQGMIAAGRRGGPRGGGRGRGGPGTDKSDIVVERRLGVAAERLPPPPGV